MIKIKFRWLALAFSAVFAVSAIVLYRYMAKSIQATDQITKTALEHVPTGSIVSTNIDGEKLGGALFVNLCAECHKSDGSGGKGPRLVRSDWVFDRDRVRLMSQKIREGSPANGMPAFAGRVREDDIGRIVAYIEWMNTRARDTQGEK